MVTGAILVVEDDATLVRSIVRNLTARGYAVRSAETVATAVQALDLECPDLVLLDEDLAMIVPLPRKQPSRRKKPTPEDSEAFRSAAGSWADVDTDKLIEDNYAMRRRSNRPHVEL